MTAAGIAIDRLADGRLAESWLSLDTLRLLRQMGAAQMIKRPACPIPAELGAARAGDG